MSGLDDAIKQAFPNGIPADALQEADKEGRQRSEARYRIAELEEHIRGIEERIADIRDFLEGTAEECPVLYFDNDWDQHPEG